MQVRRRRKLGAAENCSSAPVKAPPGQETSFWGTGGAGVLPPQHPGCRGALHPLGSPPCLAARPLVRGWGLSWRHPPNPPCLSRCTAWMKSAASCPSSTRRSPTSSIACGCPCSCTRGERRPHTFGTGPRGAQGPQHPSARAGRDEGRNTPKLQHRRVLCGVPRVPQGSGFNAGSLPPASSTAWCR